MPLVPKYYRFPPGQSLTWRPAADELADEYHIHNYDNALLYDRLSPDEMKKNYAQLLQHSSRPKVYFDTTAVSCVVELYDINKTLMAQMPVAAPTLVQSGNTLNGEQLNTFYFILPWNSVFEGYIQYQITLTYSNATTTVILSEMCLLKAYHEDAITVEWSHNLSDPDKYILFEQLGCSFSCMFHGEKPEMVPGTDATVAEGYNKQMIKVKSQSFNSWKFFFGGNHGLSDFMVDKFNRILDHAFIKIENKRYEREENTQIEQTAHPRYPLRGISFQLRDYSHDNFTFDESVATVMEIDSYPVGMPFFGMGQLGWPQIWNNPKAFYNQSDLEDFKDDLNNIFAPLIGQTGVYSRTGDVIQYTNGQNEVYQDAVQILNYGLITINIDMASATLWRYLFMHGSYHVTDWGDNSVTAQFNASTTTPSYSPHTYGSTGPFTVNIFHNDTMRKLECMEPSHGLRVRNISGSAPVQLRTFAFRYGNFSALGTAFDPSFIWPARFTLQHFIMPQCQIDGFTNGLFSTNGFQGATPAWSQLVFTDLRLNSLSSTEVDEVFNNKYQLGYTVPGSSILLAGQQPAQAPTGSSLAARQNLVSGLSCVINHD